MKLKKKLKFSDSNQVWRIKITDSDKLFIETRDTEKMKAFYHTFELPTGKKIFSGHQMDEPFWLGIEAIQEDIVFFHRYAKPDMPGHRGIFAFDINLKKTLWEDNDYAFLFIKDHLIYVYKEGFEGRYFFTINIQSGKVVEELGQNSFEINALRDEAESSVDYSNYNFPETFAPTGLENLDSIISNEVNGIEISGSIDYVHYNDLLVFNYHKVVSKSELINKLKAFDLSNNKEIFSEVLNQSANAYAPDSFFLYKNMVIIVKEKKEVLVFEIKNWVVMNISAKEKSIILQIARSSIASIYDDSVLFEIDATKYPILNSQKGAFVTLTKNNNLRGCIGYIISNLPLHKTIKDAARQAAIGDPRFPKLTEVEFNKIAIEVSILSEPFPMKSYDDIIVGTHGLILTEQGQRGLLLPQVPIDHNMNKEEYLSALCEKTGFHPGFWKEKTLNIEMFTANVFSEEEFINEWKN